MTSRFGSSRTAAFLLAIIVLGALVATAVAQGTQSPAGGDIIAGTTSPWRNARFVLYAYAVVWVGVALYLWRLTNIARRLSREVDRIEKAARDNRG